ncbi:MAG: hypothetical protein L0154_14105 [Chloroflexi bacterium]|nr:hypothetical protein [Chloroflexota bacterium]
MAATDRMYYSRDAEMRANQERTLVSIVFVMIGMGIGAAFALILASRARQRNRTGLVAAIEDRFNGIEKELGELGKRVEHRIREMR